jgi:thiamine biosynthesis lipoprotein
MSTAFLSSCASVQGDVERARYLMGTICTVQVAPSSGAESQIESAFREIARIEDLLSTWRDGSELSRVNRSAVGTAQTVSAELAAVLHDALLWEDRTEGAFNPLLGRLVRAWALRGEGTVPPPQMLAEARDAADVGRVSVDRQAATVTRHSEVEFEEGGFGKGYALDRAVEVMKSSGASRGLIDFGGQIVLFGHASPIDVAIAHPENREQPFAEVSMAEGSVSTSSGSERTFTANGRTFSHIIDPRTGEALPPRGSATVIHGQAMAADILSTALYVLGPEEGVVFAEAHDIAVIFITAREGGRYEMMISEHARPFRPRLINH